MRTGMPRSGRLAAGFVPALVALLATTSPVQASDPREDRIRANQAATVATLRRIVAAQEAFRASVVIDLDRDGVGEFTFLRELAGITPLRDAAY